MELRTQGLSLRPCFDWFDAAGFWLLEEFWSGCTWFVFKITISAQPPSVLCMFLFSWSSYATKCEEPFSLAALGVGVRGCFPHPALLALKALACAASRLLRSAFSCLPCSSGRSDRCGLELGMMCESSGLQTGERMW